MRRVGQDYLRNIARSDASAGCNYALTPHLNAGPVTADGSRCCFRPDRKRSISAQGVRSPVSSTDAAGPSRIRVPPRQTLEIQVGGRDVLAELSRIDFVAASPERAEQLGRYQVTRRRLGRRGGLRARYLCRTKGPACAAPSTPWPSTTRMSRCGILLK